MIGSQKKNKTKGETLAFQRLLCERRRENKATGATATRLYCFAPLCPSSQPLVAGWILHNSDFALLKFHFNRSLCDLWIVAIMDSWASLWNLSTPVLAFLFWPWGGARLGPQGVRRGRRRSPPPCGTVFPWRRTHLAQIATGGGDRWRNHAA